jgi:hypothetical protein
MTAMKLVLNTLKKMVRVVIPTRPEETSQLESQRLKHLVRGIMTARPDEIGCDECFDQLDRFVDMILEGKSAAEAMPLVQDHLGRCRECREEFEALLAALRALA